MFRYVKGGNGFSLVEVMIALCVLLLVFMGLMQTALLSIDSNMRNILRDEALRIAAQRMEETRNLPFGVVASDPAGVAVTLPACGNPPISFANYPVLLERDFRNIENFQYGSIMGVTNLDPGPDTILIQITVRWQYRDECYSHTISSLRRR